nr:MAG TPA: hypothetical protein [Caudoviricetes sp.]
MLVEFKIYIGGAALKLPLFFLGARGYKLGANFLVKAFFYGKIREWKVSNTRSFEHIRGYMIYMNMSMPKMLI